MASTAIRRDPEGPGISPDPPSQAALLAEMKRLRQENRRLAVTLGCFSSFLAARGLLEEAWSQLHRIHQMDEGREI